MSSFVDWEWANSLRSLAIFEAAGLSMGFELNALPPVGSRFTGRDYIEPPPGYRERVIWAFEAARDGELLRTGRTAERGKTFDPEAEFETGQLWEIDPADFLRWCEAEGLPVPAEWLPRGYAPEQNTAPPAPVANPKAKRRTWWDVSSPYIVEVMQTGQYATCKELYRALDAKAGPDSPFDKGTGANRGSLFVREIAQSLDVKTVQNKWRTLRELAQKITP